MVFNLFTFHSRPSIGSIECTYILYHIVSITNLASSSDIDKLDQPAEKG